MNVYINSSPFVVEEKASIEKALLQQGVILQRGIAVAVNNIVIPKEKWSQKELNENDKIVIIRASQGG